MLLRLRALLFPAPADEGFRQECLGDARLAALVLGGLEVLLAVALPVSAMVVGVAIGLATLLSARIPRMYESLWMVAIASAALWSAVTVLQVPALATAIVVCGFALLPLTPVQAVVFAAVAVLGSRGITPVPAVGVAGAILAPLQYRYRRDRYESHLKLVQSTQELRLQQERALSAEHAASLERLAAAMSHELNTPVGAMKSSVQTLRSIVEKYEGASESRRQNLQAMHVDICNCLLNSTARVQSIVARLQRLTSLDRAAVRPTDINQILQDVAATVEASTSHEVPIRLNLHPVPNILCETQAWITILTRLVSNAASQPAQRMLELTSRFRNGNILVELIEVGRETDAAQLARALEPAFAETGGRIGTSNWSLFQARGWVRQLGGDLRLSNEPSGTVARLTIPAEHMEQAAAASIKSAAD